MAATGTGLFICIIYFIPQILPNKLYVAALHFLGKTSLSVSDALSLVFKLNMR